MSVKNDSKNETRHHHLVDFVPLLSADAGPPEDPARIHEFGEETGAIKGNLDFFLSSIENDKQTAYQKGFADGEKQTLEILSEKLGEQISHWAKMLKDLSEEVARGQREFFETIEERTVSLSVRIAEKILGYELGARPECLNDRIRGAVARQQSEPAIAIRVNPNDRVFLDKLLRSHPAEGEEEAKSTEFELVEDPGIEAGGFFVETRLALLDHTISSQLRKIESELADLYERTDA